MAQLQLRLAASETGRSGAPRRGPGQRPGAVARERVGWPAGQTPAVPRREAEPGPSRQAPAVQVRRDAPRPPAARAPPGALRPLRAPRERAARPRRGCPAAQAWPHLPRPTERARPPPPGPRAQACRRSPPRAARRRRFRTPRVDGGRRAQVEHDPRRSVQDLLLQADGRRQEDSRQASARRHRLHGDAGTASAPGADEERARLGGQAHAKLPSVSSLDLERRRNVGLEDDPHETCVAAHADVHDARCLARLRADCHLGCDGERHRGEQEPVRAVPHERKWSGSLPCVGNLPMGRAAAQPGRSAQAGRAQRERGANVRRFEGARTVLGPERAQREPSFWAIMRRLAGG